MQDNCLICAYYRFSSRGRLVSSKRKGEASSKGSSEILRDEGRSRFSASSKFAQTFLFLVARDLSFQFLPQLSHVRLGQSITVGLGSDCLDTPVL